MRYLMRAGALSNGGGERLAQIRSALWGAGKTISLTGTSAQYQTEIDTTEAPAGRSGDARWRVYTLRDGSGAAVMDARPGYAEGDDLEAAGRPAFRAPRVDHAEVRIGEAAYLLVMHSGQSYSLRERGGGDVLRISHRGLSGGWTIDTAGTFAAQVLCGLFIFCRYIEQENEFIVV